MSDILTAILGLAVIMAACNGIDYIGSYAQKIVCSCGNESSVRSYIRKGDIDDCGMPWYHCPKCSKKF